MVSPAQNETFLGCPETAEDIVECIQVVPPICTRDELVAYFLEETLQGTEVITAIWLPSRAAIDFDSLV